MIPPLALSEVRRLRVGLASALWEALIVDPQRTGAHEPQLVANMVHRIPNRVNSLPPFAGGRVTLKSGGVFVHGQPQVNSRKFSPKNKSVEIGDLLLIRRERGPGIPSTSPRALLLQAKRYWRRSEQPDNENQRLLYARWPRFEYTSPSELGRKPPRLVTGGDKYDGAKYLLIHREVHLHPRYPDYLDCVLTAYPTRLFLTHHRRFLNELLRFVLGRAGRRYAAPPWPTNTNWDSVVNDLIEVTRNRGTAPMERSRTSGARDRREGLFFVAGSFGEGSALAGYNFEYARYHDGSDGPPQVPVEREGDEGRGISIIEFVVENRLDEQ